MAQAKKIYAGSGKKKSDTWFSISINIDKIQDYIQEYNGTRFVKLNVNVNKEPDQYGKDVSVSVDTYEPNKSSNGRSGSVKVGGTSANTTTYSNDFDKKTSMTFVNDSDTSSDLPF